MRVTILERRFMATKAKSKAAKKRKPLVLKKKFVISQDLASFIPQVSRMGGSNPVDWLRFRLPLT